MWGRGLRGSNGACSSLCWISVTPTTTHNQIRPFWCWFLSGWACVQSRTLWVSPTNSLVRLVVSPASASTPAGVFNQWFEALFPHAGALGCGVFHSVHQLLPHRPGCSFAHPAPQSATLLGVPAAALPRVLSAKLPISVPPAHLRPSYWSGWMFLLYLLGCWTSAQFDFLSVLVVFCF